MVGAVSNMKDSMRLMNLSSQNSSSFQPKAEAKFTNESHHIFSRLFLMPVIKSNMRTDCDHEFKYFSIDGIIRYVGFCDDFGPISLDGIFKFCKIVDDLLSEFPNHNLAMQTDRDCKSLTNSVFLIGSYMIMMCGSTVDDVKESMKSLKSKLLSYKDVSNMCFDFKLHLEDCWAGLWRAKKSGWVDFGPNGFDSARYQHYDNPFHADLHVVVPGKFIAMKGPRHLKNDLQWADIYTNDGEFSHRDFSPTYYADILQHFNVQAVVRLNEPQYDERDFIKGGIALTDLYFDDCTVPPADVVAKFMTIAEGIPGVLAVHCRAGLGRTGTLIAMYMMAHCSFTAREAIGWLRIVRPGSVIGVQQQYLCDKEDLMRRAGERSRERGPLCAMRGSGVAAALRLVSEAKRVVDERIDAVRRHADKGKSTPPPTIDRPSTALGRDRPAHDRVGDTGVATRKAACTTPTAAAAVAEHIAASVARRSLARAAAGVCGPSACGEPKLTGRMRLTAE